MLITGGSGFLGRHLLASDARKGWEVIAPPSKVLDVCSQHRVFDQIREWRPTAVVHLAYRRDDRRSIVAGSANVAAAAHSVGARLVHLSTDVVFGGRSLPYREFDAVGPLGDYGMWKAEAEREVMAAHPQAVMLRTSLLYGTERRSPIQLDVEHALRGTSTMTFFTDEIRCPVHAADLAAVVARLAGRTDVVGPLHVAGSQPMSRADFAAANARWMGLDPSGLRTSSIAESGLVRAARIVLDSSLAAELGFHCRSVDEALTG